VFFGKQGMITENDPIEQEKRLKYLDLVASAVILQNTVDMSLAIQTLMSQGEVIPMRYLAALSPYITRHIKRYGDYVVNLHNIPQPLEAAINGVKTRYPQNLARCKVMLSNHVFISCKHSNIA
jgi:hypothetical protein